MMIPFLMRSSLIVLLIRMMEFLRIVLMLVKNFDTTQTTRFSKRLVLGRIWAG